MKEDTQRGRWSLAIGIAEADPPPLPWRALRTIFASPDQEDTHLWSFRADEFGVPRGARLPAGVFAARVEEGHVFGLPEPLDVPPHHVIVRRSDGLFHARPWVDVRRESHDFVRTGVTEALRAIDRGDVEEALDRLEQARMAEGQLPLATVLLVGLALETPEADWSRAILDRLRDELARLELDLLVTSFEWDDLPARECRERWLERVEMWSRRRPPAFDKLIPPAPELQARSALLLAARRLLPSECDALRRLPHRRLAALVACQPEALEEVLSSLQRDLDVGSADEVIEVLQSRLESLGEAGRRELERCEVAARLSSFERHAAAVWRLEATLGDERRSAAWQSARACLNRVRPSVGVPWARGEAAAEELRAYWLAMDEPVLPRAVAWFREKVGLALFPTHFAPPDIEACHVVDRRQPPSSYLSVEETLQTAPRVRFAAAKALGFQVFAADRPGGHFSHQVGREGGASTEAEKAANAFAAYFLAPREAVRSKTHNRSLGHWQGYAAAVSDVMREFGLSRSAAFVHVANCHERQPPFGWFATVAEHTKGAEHEERWRDDRLEVPAFHESDDVPLERADGFATLLAQAVAEGRVPRENAVRLLGGSVAAGERLLQSRISMHERLV